MDECDRRHYAAGYCNPHWRRWKRHGDPGSPVIGVRRGSCTFPDCTLEHYAKGFCMGHYAQSRRGKEMTPLGWIRGQGPEPTMDGRRRRAYGITAEQYQRLMEDQGGVCAICGGVSSRALHVDHDHSCCPGKKACGECIRGLLCSNCNTGLGMFKDDVNLMAKAVKYLEVSRARS